MSEHEFYTNLAVKDAHVPDARSQVAQSSKKDRFYESAPHRAFFLNAEDAEGLGEFLRGKNWLAAGERLLSAEIAAC